jgi:hypothetical protein
VTSGYGEWAAARTPSLLRLALVVAGSDEAADRAVRAALARTWSSWETILRTDDPDLRARHFLLAACPTRRVPAPVRVPVPAGGPEESTPPDVVGPWLDSLPLRRRAAVVLRHLEERPDTEIAEILGTPASVVRKDLERAVADLPGDALREALVALASSAPAQLSGPVAAVDAPPVRRLRSPWVAALAVLGLVVTVALVNKATQAPPGVIRYPSVTAPSAWRAESYDGVQVRVPDTWGWGGAPLRSDIFGGHRLGACGANQAAVLSPSDHSSYISSATPFVGRPAKMSERCLTWGSDGVMPSGDAVWFDSPMAVGVKPLGAVLAETRAVGDQHVTVFSGDPALRRQILGTAQQVEVDANGCPTRAVQRPVSGASAPAPASMSVCVYSQDTGTAVLLWSALKDSASARAYVQAFAAAGPGGRTSCPVTPQGEWVALGIRDSRGGAERWDVLDLGCARLIGRGTEAALTVADVAPWAGGGTTAYVGLPRGLDGGLAPYFRGALSD